MFAVLFYMPHGAYGFGWWLMAGLVILAGLGPFGAWVRATRTRLLVAKATATVIIAGLIGATTYAAICGACQGCDPFWMEWFYICWPVN